jgi:hypothetical protein
MYKIPRRGGPLCPPARYDCQLLFGWPQTRSPLARWMPNLRVGEGRCALPRVSKINCLRSSLFDSRLRGGCIACVPRSPDGTRNPVDGSVRLGFPVSSGGQVGRPSPMVTIGLFRDDMLVLTIVDGARPASRRMGAGLQYPIADQSG